LIIPGNSYLSIDSEIIIVGLENGMYFIQILTWAGKVYFGEFVVLDN